MQKKKSQNKRSCIMGFLSARFLSATKCKSSEQNRGGKRLVDVVHVEVLIDIECLFLLKYSMLLSILMYLTRLILTACSATLSTTAMGRAKWPSVYSWTQPWLARIHRSVYPPVGLTITRAFQGKGKSLQGLLILSRFLHFRLFITHKTIEAKQEAKTCFSLGNKTAIVCAFINNNSSRRQNISTLSHFFCSSLSKLSLQFLIINSVSLLLKFPRLVELAEDGGQAGPDELLVLGSVDLGPDTLLLVVLDNGDGLLVVGDQALLEGLGVVVRALDERLASDVVLHGDLGGSELSVVRAARGDVDQASSDAGHQQVVVNGQLDNGVQVLLLVLQHGIELLGLDSGAGESIENESVFFLKVRSQYRKRRLVRLLLYRFG